MHRLAQHTLCVLLLFLLTFTGFAFSAHIQEAEAAPLPAAGALFYGNGSDGGWGLYTDYTLTTRYAHGEGSAWTAGPNTLTLTDFEYSSPYDSVYGLCLLSDVSIKLQGSNTLQVANAQYDTFCLMVGYPNRAIDSINVVIEGQGSLLLSTLASTYENTGIYLTKDSSLTISGTRVDVITGTSERSAVYALEGTRNAQLIIENGAQVSLTGNLTEGQDSHGLYLDTTLDEPLTIKGANSSLTLAGRKVAVVLGARASAAIDYPYGLDASSAFSSGDGFSFHGLESNAIVGTWGTLNNSNAISYYTYELNGNPQGSARYIRFGQAPTILSTALPQAVIDTDYSYIMSGDGDTQNYMWSYNRRYPLPPGMTFNHITGELSGTPTQLGTWTIQIGVGNAFGTSAKYFSIEVASTPSPSPSNDDEGLAKTADRAGSAAILVGVLSVCSCVLLILATRRKHLSTR